MKDLIPEEIRNIFEEILKAEQQISCGLYEPYNAFVAPGDAVTAISASGRVMLGREAVCEATVNVAAGNVREHDRFVEYISFGGAQDMYYAVLKTGVEIDQEDGSTDSLCWVITLVIQKVEGSWKLIHRHNTRAKR